MLQSALSRCLFLLLLLPGVIFETLSVAFGFFANFYSMDIFRHGVPIGAGLAAFLIFQFHKSYQKLADEVVTEVRKVVWPGKKRALLHDCFGLHYFDCFRFGFRGF